MPAGKKVNAGKLAVAGAVKKVVLKQKVPIKSKTAPQTGGSKAKPKPVKCDSIENKSAVEEAGGALKSIETTVTESVSDADEVAEKLAITGGNVEESVALECTEAENQPRTGGSKLDPNPVKSETVDDTSTMEVDGEKLTIAGNLPEGNMPAEAENQPEAGQNQNGPLSGTCVSVKETIQVEELAVFNPDSQPDAVKCVETEDGEPMQLGETQSTQLQEVASGTFLKKEKSAPLDISAGGGKPAAPPLETPPPGSPVKGSQHAEPNLPGPAQSRAESPEIKTEALAVQQSDERLKTNPEGRLDTWLHAST